MIRQTFPNRLAAGGYWAICMAEASRRAIEEMAEAGMPAVPIGSGSPPEVFTTCGLGAFEYVVNCYMPAGAHLHVAIQFQQPIKHPPLFDRQGQPIDLSRWFTLVRNAAYRRVAMWENDSGDRQVSTIWTGFDPYGKGEIFETIVYSPCEAHRAHLHGHIRASTEAEAMHIHEALVAAVRAGQV